MPESHALSASAYCLREDSSKANSAHDPACVRSSDRLFFTAAGRRCRQTQEVSAHDNAHSNSEGICSDLRWRVCALECQRITAPNGR